LNRYFLEEKKMTITLPESHIDLVEEPIHAVLTTVMPDGQPQSSLVWCDYDGATVRVNTTRERQKGKNMAANPKVSLLLIDLRDSSRWMEIRGEVEITKGGAIAHLDELTRQYTDNPCYYGYIFPEEQRERETRIIAKIYPKKINRDAIHKE
jgi:PPOX class probable F420-dependent enzyme